ncbi:hypothetical protein ACFQZO_24410 [Bradyrhizobium sp. GCM10027634]|uniref:hypothetical protein n=1 Tax=unclassified Bradyrhizobium TaxID=2631580 RepID=UPI00263AA434|nr:hypothetical protein [Bradyrhizobium sp. WYCCWR 12677]MDN5003985.1 hypothetical protein [Bradyrhizobium sp. WYCCWR 12677]
MTLSHGTSLRRVPRDKGGSDQKPRIGPVGTNGTSWDKRDEFEAIARALDAGAQLSDQERRAVAEALRALVLPAARHAERDALIVDCRRRFFADRRDRAAAHEIAIGWARYEGSGWRSGERAADRCPERLIGTPKEFYWRMLRAFPQRLGAESIRKLLAATMR